MRTVVSGVVAALSALGVAYLVGVRVNTTHSIPPGFYVKSNAVIGRGAIVLACPPAGPATQEAQRRGYIGYSPVCAERLEQVMKRVAGVPGDLVEETPDGLAVNGELLANTKPLAEDPAGRPLSMYFRGRIQLGPDQLLLVGDTQNSFDSRYFGPVSTSAVRSVLAPVWTW